MTDSIELPMNLEAERDVLGILLNDTNLIAAAAQRLNEKSFGNVAHLSIWQQIRAMWQDGKEINVVTVSEAMRTNGSLDRMGGPGKLFDADREGQRYFGSGEKFLTPLCDTLTSYRKARAGVMAATAAMEAARSGDIAKMQAELEGGLREAADSTDARKGKLWREIGLAFTERDVKKLKGIPTGYPFLDNYIGGLIKGKLLLIAGGSGDGKSTLALCILLNAVRATESKEPALVFSQEMSAEENWTRGLCYEKGVRSSAVATGLFNRGELDSMGKYLLEHLPITVFDDCSTLAEIVTEIRVAVMRDRARIVLVDYIQIVNGDKAQKREEEISTIGLVLKQLAHKLQITIIGLTQVNDDGLVRESRALKMHCDQMVQIFVNPEDDTVRRLRIQKNRGGKRYVSCDFRFIGENFSFIEVGEVKDMPPEQPKKKKP